MLGRLARWLRLIGMDVLYYPDIEDKKLIRIAREQDRTVLTKDSRLIAHKALNKYIFITSNNTFDQLHQILGLSNVIHADLMARCTVCNGILIKAKDKKEIKEHVPDFIYHNINDFFTCDGCGKVYWKGTHFTMFTKKLNALFSQTETVTRGKDGIED